MSRSIENEISKIACVIVAYNNGDNIEKLLETLLTQSRPIEEIIVVDNASSDGTPQMIRQNSPQVTLMVNASNIGVGGGYAQGMEYAHQKGYEWIWLLDGDSLPRTSALEELAKAFTSLSSAHPKIGILASSPVTPLTNERYDGFLWRGRFVRLPKEPAQCQKPFRVDSVISSGCLVSRRVIEGVGLPRADFFMDFVDHEYNLRVCHGGYEIVYVPNSIIYHHIGKPRVVKSRIVRAIARLATKSPVTAQPPWRAYYEVRNELYTFWHEFRNYKALFFVSLHIIRMIGGMLLFNDKEKVKRMNYIIRGLRDGFKGKLGRIVAPE